MKQTVDMEKFFSSHSNFKQTKIEAYADKGIITISGSLLNIPSDSGSGSTSKLYQDFLNWLNEYAESPAPRTSVEFSIFYADTPSTFFLSKVCEKLTEIARRAKVHATWVYHPEDETILDLGLDLKEASFVELELIKSA